MATGSEKEIVWTEYMRYRARMRGLDLQEIERIVRYSGERYSDTATGRKVAVGKHHGALLMVPYEETEGRLSPITAHHTTRQQVSFRMISGRFIHE